MIKSNLTYFKIKEQNRNSIAELLKNLNPSKLVHVTRLHNNLGHERVLNKQNVKKP